MTQEESRSEPGAAPVLSVVIPALNEQDGIAEIAIRVLSAEPALREAGVGGLDLIVVNDGSLDRTAEIAGNIPGVRLINHIATRGYGAAIKTGFSHARGGLLAFLDADGTYPPEQFPSLCRAILDSGADVAVGSRRSGESSQMPAVRRLGNLLWSNLVSLIGNKRCMDPASGMRVLRREALPRLYPLPDGLNFTPVMSTRALHEGLKVMELPISYHERQGRSKLSVVYDGTRFLKTILWTSLEYNPVKVLGIIGLLFLALAFSIGLGLVISRLRGVTSLGPWAVFTLHGALVLAVTGVSIYSLGLTFNALVALFHRRPPRQGMFAGAALERSLEVRFGWIGLLSIGLGLGVALTTMILGAAGWEIARLWLWLLGSAMFFLVGFQLVISWIVARVLEALAVRDALVHRELDSNNRVQGEGAEDLR